MARRCISGKAFFENGYKVMVEGLTHKVDGISPAEWDYIVNSFCDANLYQTSAYGEVRWGPRNISRIVVYDNKDPVACAQVRIFQTILKRGIAYVRWGPLYNKDNQDRNKRALKYIANAMTAEYVHRRRLVLRVLPSAFIGDPRSEDFSSAFGEFLPVDHVKDRTILLNIDRPIEAIRRAFDQKWRNQLNRAERNQVQIIDESAGGFHLFETLYRQMWERKRFTTTVNVTEFGRICASLSGPQRFAILIAYENGAPVAGIVLSTLGPTGIYLLGATNEAGMKCKAAYLLQWTAIQHLQRSGCGFYDLGGVDPEGNPGVYHFKQGLSGTEVERCPAVELCSDALSSIIVRAGEAYQRFRRKVT